MTTKRNIALIENDHLVINSWKINASERIDVGLFTYANMSQFLNDHHPKDIIVYIDKNLENVSGLDIASDLFNKGYESLYITTGDHDKQNEIMNQCPFIKGVIDKCFPN